MSLRGMCVQNKISISSLKPPTQTIFLNGAIMHLAAQAKSFEVILYSHNSKFLLVVPLKFHVQLFSTFSVVTA